MPRPAYIPLANERLKLAAGALGSWGAALLAPYTDKPDTSGILVTSPTVLEGLAKRFWDDGFQVVRAPRPV